MYFIVNTPMRTPAEGESLAGGAGLGYARTPTQIFDQSMV
jgi:hypothetical protein